ncbi:unnamed protein product [Strongylus vulgaris]|uniref:Uncharacterized protein n=1 Tax=Strongylus vulgaris TaxID=40348 RepID=A0A3P7I3H8_STRVU|nr:unnamed protein product [Strongylus vulgaris]
MTSAWFIVLLLTYSSNAVVRIRRQAALAVNQQDIPITLRSLITCLTPGIRENLCFGPRVEVLKSEKLGLTERRGAAYGYVNGVDIGLLKPHNIPMIEDETEIGHHIGAVVDVTDRDGAIEFGDRLKAFKAFRLNNGGITEWDSQGAGTDIGSRASAADDLVRLRWTLFGVNVGPTASRTLVGPGPSTLGRAKGAGEYKFTLTLLTLLANFSKVLRELFQLSLVSPYFNKRSFTALKTYTPFPSFYRGYHTQGDWYRNQFYKQVLPRNKVWLTPIQRVMSTKRLLKEHVLGVLQLTAATQCNDYFRNSHTLYH